MFYRDIHTAAYDATILGIGWVGYNIPQYTPSLAVLEKLESSGFWAMLGVLLLGGRWLVAIEKRLTEQNKVSEHLTQKIDEYFESRLNDSRDVWNEIGKLRDGHAGLREQMAAHHHQTPPGPRKGT